MMNFSYIFFVFVIVFLFSQCIPDSTKNIYGDSEDIVDLDTTINSLSIKVFSNEENRYSTLMLRRLTTETIDSITITKGFLYKYIVDDLNNDSITDIILKFSDDKSGAYIILMYDSSYKFFKDYGDYVHDIEPIFIDGKTEYVTYRTFGCADAVWESDLIRFKGDKLSVLFKYEEDFCELSEKQMTLKYFNENDTISMKIDSVVFGEKNLQSLWSKLIGESGIPSREVGAGSQE